MNVTHKKPYKMYEGKTNDLLIAYIGYVNDLNQLQQFKVSVQKSHHYDDGVGENSACCSSRYAIKNRVKFSAV